MIYSLNGKVIEKLSDRAVIECFGVGYEVQMTRNGISALAAQGDNAFVYIHMIVREDSIELFGFCNVSERDSFKTLLGISGIGPKAAARCCLSLLRESLPPQLQRGYGIDNTCPGNRSKSCAENCIGA